MCDFIFICKSCISPYNVIALFKLSNSVIENKIFAKYGLYTGVDKKDRHKSTANKFRCPISLFMLTAFHGAEHLLRS